MEFILTLLYIGALIYIANADDLRRSTDKGGSSPSMALPWMLYGLISITLLFAILLIYLAFAPDMTAAMEELGLPPLEINRAAAIINLVLAIVLCGLAARIVMSVQARQWIQRFVSGRYNPESSVHTTALVLALLAISIFIGQFVQQGGLTGLAQSLQESGSLSINSVFFDAVLRVILAFLGVGLAIRRTLPQTLERLGLRIPTTDDVLWGIGVGILVLVAQIAATLVWEAMVPPEEFAEQIKAANQIGLMINTLPLALLISLTAAVSEELFFRGALQPVFGLIPTSVFFVVLHIQYTLTPASLILFGVSLAFGWLRQRQSTTAAIVAHFLYDFIPLALQVLASTN